VQYRRVIYGATDGILLKPERSGRRLIEAILHANELDFDAAFEPGPENADVVRSLVRFLEELHPLTFHSFYDYDRSIKRSAARRIEAAAKVNAGLAEMVKLKPEGLHVLSGQFTRWGLRMRWSSEADRWVNFVDQTEEVLTVMVLRIAPVSTTSLHIPLWGERPPTTGPGGDLDDEIPF
jgi:hypothetical protein